ncbi:MAG: hypothetical protein MUC50_21280 [Myxococcota bacterium]|jgi:hypothetical protein|nr:hypothetical protein [Myxococcota bacterium]
MRARISEVWIGIIAACFLFGCSEPDYLLGDKIATQQGVSADDAVWLERIDEGLSSASNEIAARSYGLSPDNFTAEPATAHDIYSLVPGRYPDTVGLEEVIQHIVAQPQGEEFLRSLLEDVAQATGTAIDPSWFEAFQDNPNLALDMLQFTPVQLDALRKVALDILTSAGGDLPQPSLPMPAPLKAEYQLPRIFDFGTFAADQYTVPPGELLPLGFDLYWGVLRDKNVPPQQLRENFVLAEVVERLGTNVRAQENERFVVIYNGQRYARLADFLQALIENGHKINAKVRHYVAPFVPVYSRDESGVNHPVAATVFLRTGYKDSNGTEGVLPLMHSEMVFSIRPTAATKGKRINGTVQYYQGIPKTGFYGEGSMELPSWLGKKVSDSSFSTEEAALAMVYGGYVVDVIRAVAQERNAPFDGWGLSGVCNDSAAVLQQAVHGKVNSYPLFMNDELLNAEISKRLAASEDLSALDLKAYEALMLSIAKTPDDITRNRSTRRRLLTSLPWKPGTEPFYSTIDARRIVE